MATESTTKSTYSANDTNQSRALRGASPKGIHTMKTLINVIFGFAFTLMAIPTFFLLVDASLLAAAVCCACMLSLAGISFHAAAED